jgi:hypothetical protein
MPAVVLRAAVAASLLASAIGVTPVRGAEPPPLPQGAIAIIEAIEGTEPQTVQLDVTAPCCTVDGTAPAVAIPDLLDRLTDLQHSTALNVLARRHVAAATAALDGAWAAFTGGPRVARQDPSDLGHLESTLGGLKRSIVALTAADRVAGRFARDVAEIRASITGVAGRIARDVHGVAQDAGVSARRLAQIAQLLSFGQRAETAGLDLAAVGFYGSALGLGGGAIEFDIDAFEQNIVGALAGQTIGYTYAISLFDTVYVSDHFGEARIAPDNTPLPQDPGKEMHLASASRSPRRSCCGCSRRTA